MQYIWTDPDLDGLQFCVAPARGLTVAVHDGGNYAALAITTRRAQRLEHYSTAELARRAGEERLWRMGVAP